MQKSTGDLIKELSLDSCNIEKFIADNADELIENDVSVFWENCVSRSGMSKANIINKSDFSYRYFYDVINGRKIPSRDKIIRLIITMKLTLEDCQEGLRLSEKCALYPRIRRDSIIIYALNNAFTLNQLQELLAENNEVAVL